ncbi:site-specific DNA-methyltransferase [Patescibacteria group bacterium]|nr:site-specific DNA-methyltransferase [Patescibacteria group bacterium]
MDLLNLLPKKPHSKGENFLLHKGDCISLMNSMPEASVDLVFADPPYNLSNGGISVQSGKMVSVNKGNWDKTKGLEDDFNFHKDWIIAAKRILKPEGTLWVSGTYHSIYQCGYLLQLAGFHILNDIAWFKPNASPNISCRYFTASHETLIWARKSKKHKHVFNYKDVKNGDWPDDFFKNEGKQMRSVWHVPHDESVWVLGTTKKTEKEFGRHPTQKPVALLERIIKSSTKKNAIVLDPFTGSSTTGVAALGLGRRFIGFDTEKEYLDLSKKRLVSSSKQLSR